MYHDIDCIADARCVSDS